MGSEPTSVNSLAWMMSQLEKPLSFPEQVSDPVALEEAQREYRNAIPSVRAACKTRWAIHDENKKARG